MLLGYVYCMLSDMYMWNKQWWATEELIKIEEWKGIPREISTGGNLYWSGLFHSKIVIALLFGIVFAALLMAKSFKALPGWTPL
jgi:hypothetical protein